MSKQNIDLTLLNKAFEACPKYSSRGEASQHHPYGFGEGNADGSDCYIVIGGWHSDAPEAYFAPDSLYNPSKELINMYCSGMPAYTGSVWLERDGVCGFDTPLG